MIDRATHRTILMRRISPSFQLGLEINEGEGEVNPVANWRALSETATRPAVIFGTSSDRIGTPHGQAYYVTLSKSLQPALDVPVAPYVGLSYSEFEDKFLVPWGIHASLTPNWSAMLMHDGVNSHLAATYAWKRHSVTLLAVERRNFGINLSTSF